MTSKRQVAQHQEGAVAGAQAAHLQVRAARAPPSSKGWSRCHIMRAPPLPPSRRPGRPRSPPGCASLRAGVPSAILRPWCSTITRSTWRSSVVTACSIQTTVRSSSSRRRRISARHLLDLGLGQAGGHFVEQQHARPRGQRHADLQQPLLRRRDRAGRQRGLRRQADQLQDAGRHRAAPRARTASSPHSQYLRGRRPANFRPNSMLSQHRHVGEHARRLEGARQAVRGEAVRRLAGEVVARRPAAGPRSAPARRRSR